jgi:hypothetical protein
VADPKSNLLLPAAVHFFRSLSPVPWSWRGMPSIQMAGVMLLFWNILKDRSQEERLPWASPEWQRRTEIAGGLFPKDANTLPSYIGWNKAQMDLVRSLFDSCANLSNDDLRTALSNRGPPHLQEARKLWGRAWDAIWKKAGGNDVIDKVLHDYEYHPHDVMRAEVENGLDPSFPVKPNGLAALHQELGETLFGTEVLLQRTLKGELRMSNEVGSIMELLLTHAWHRYDSATKRMAKKADKIEVEARNEYGGEQFQFTLTARCSGDFCLGKGLCRLLPWPPPLEHAAHLQCCTKALRAPRCASHILTMLCPLRAS